MKNENQRGYLYPDLADIRSASLLWHVQGFDTKDFQEAKALLNELT